MVTVLGLPQNAPHHVVQAMAGVVKAAATAGASGSREAVAKGGRVGHLDATSGKADVEVDQRKAAV